MSHTADPIAVPPHTATRPIRPEFIRLPKPTLGALCPWTGLSRSKMNELVLPCEANGFKAPVKSVCLRRNGAAKGVRLVHLQSLLDYLHANIEGGA